MNRKQFLKAGLLAPVALALGEIRGSRASTDYLGTFCENYPGECPAGVVRRWYDLYQRCTSSGCYTYRVIRTNWVCGYCP